VGVDREGRKHILGIEAGATENATATRVMAASAMDLNILIGYCDLDRPALAQSPATFSAPPTACTVRRLRRV